MAGSVQISSSTSQVIKGPACPATTDEAELAKSDLWIFREGKREVSGPARLRELEQRLSVSGALLDCLIEAGELEAALADLDSRHASGVATLTDALARQLCTGIPHDRMDLERLAKQIETPTTITISPPEGFTYYALHPLDFQRIAEQVSAPSARYAVIGIRSIGTTLSAVTTAAFELLGKSANRITVRPTGHPYARTTQFTPAQQRWIQHENSRDAQFVIVDEGPGRSGSTFLSVAEALRRAGVGRERITIVGSREFDPQTLCAEGSAERWREFRFLATTPSTSRFANCLYLGGGDWRMYFCQGDEDWPESWTQMERFKVLSADRRELIKFEGMGQLGKEARERALTLARAGFSPAVANYGDGFLAYAAVDGKHLRRQNANTGVLEQIARYCAFRASEFRSTQPPGSELAQMLEFNVQQEFGRELVIARELGSQNPVLVDGRMQPHEWIGSSGGEIYKTDAISHGDNHFFPGPCGIAWDLAGAAVEWELDKAATGFLLAKFRQFSGVDVSPDLHLYRLAYCVFRLGFCKMGRSTVVGLPDQVRLDSAYRRYRARAAELIGLTQA
jgi:hypothetical protein